MPTEDCGLHRIYGEIAARVPDVPHGRNDFVFHAGVLPEPPAQIETDRIVVEKGHHHYNSCYRADGLAMYADPRACRDIGVFLLAAVLHGPRVRTTLTLAHVDSQIRRIVIDAHDLSLENCRSGLSTKPFAFRYWPDETKKHPWLYDARPICDLPLLIFTNQENSVGPRDEDWDARDTIYIPAESPGTVLLAELFLNAGCPSNPVREYQLEGDAGFRGVGPMSAELQLFLPGSFPWTYGEDVTKPRGQS